MRRNLLYVSLALIFSFAVAVPSALAQTVFGLSSTSLPTRGEGTAEAVGQTVLTNIANNATIKSGSTITITYSAAIANAPKNGGPITPNVPGSFVQCNPVAVCDSTTITAIGKAITLTYTADTTGVNAGATVTIAGVRINANALGSGTIYATGSATVPTSSATTNPITFTGTNPVPVATVNKLATTVTFSVSELTGLPLGPGSIVTCVGATSSADFSLNIAENFPTALTTLSDEQGLAPLGNYNATGGLVTNGSNLLVTLTGIPTGVTINAGSPVSCTSYPPSGTKPSTDLPTSACVGGSLTVAPAVAGTVTAGVQTFFYVVTADTQTVTESVDLPFTVTSTGPLPTGLTPNTITATVSLASSAAVAGQYDEPAFVGNEASFVAVNISDCVTNVLFPYVSTYNGSGTDPDSHYNTGIVISNTTLDPYGAKSGGATPQAGSCTLTLYPGSGS